MSFRISWSNKGGTRIAAVQGRIDSTNSNEFESQLEYGLGDDTDSVVLDFAQVVFMSSAGLRVLLQLVKAYTAPRSLSVCGLSSLLVEIFRISGFDQVVTTYKSRAAALDALHDG